jgi:hypothetical protein
VLYDKRDTTFAAIHLGDSLIIVSYKDDAKKISQPQAGVAIEQQVQGFPSPIIADEIHITPKEKDKKKNDTAKKKSKLAEKKITFQEIALLASKIVGSLLLLILLLPFVYLIYRLVRVAFAKNPNDQADQIYRAALYRFHMAGFERDAETPLDYARTKVDPTFNLKFEEFMRLYLRLKYSNGSLRSGDQEIINSFAKSIGTGIRKRIGFFRRTFNYFNVSRASRFFQQPSSINNENQSL